MVFLSIYISPTIMSARIFNLFRGELDFRILHEVLTP